MPGVSDPPYPPLPPSGVGAMRTRGPKSVQIVVVCASTPNTTADELTRAPNAADVVSTASMDDKLGPDTPLQEFGAYEDENALSMFRIADAAGNERRAKHVAAEYAAVSAVKVMAKPGKVPFDVTAGAVNE